MSVSNFIKATALAFGVLGASASVVQSRDLRPEERSICPALKICLDIVRRHDATEFDYTVLDIEFRRFGQPGKSALFSLLEDGAEHDDVALLISSLGPLTQQDRQRVTQKWSLEKAGTYLPLLLDGHPMSRDFLLQSLLVPNADARETVRLALNRLPRSANTAPLPEAAQKALVTAINMDPVPEAAPFLARMNSEAYEAEFAGFLRSGSTRIVLAAYSALYRKNPAQAFNVLLAEMEHLETLAQARAIGDMLAVRHRSRADGFYLKFARDMSGDPKVSMRARASGLHAVLIMKDEAFPELTPERAVALAFLVSANPFTAQKDYLPYLKKVKADAAMNLIWDVANRESWVNRDHISSFFEDTKSADRVVSHLLQSNDVRTFRAGLAVAKPLHKSLIRSQIESPVAAIGDVARRVLKLKVRAETKQSCSIAAFDLEDKRNQMPFFDSGWMVSDKNARLSLPHSYLTTAHPTRTGWLGGYDLAKSNNLSAQSGGALLHYNNKTGAFQNIGDFSGLVAILPSRPLKLGQSSDQFWVVDRWGGSDSADISAYLLDLKAPEVRLEHIAVLPKTGRDFSVTVTGDLLISFSEKTQSPIRLSQRGDMSLACSATSPTNAFR